MDGGKNHPGDCDEDEPDGETEMDRGGEGRGGRGIERWMVRRQIKHVDVCN